MRCLEGVVYSQHCGAAGLHLSEKRNKQPALNITLVNPHNSCRKRWSVFQVLVRCPENQKYNEIT